MKSRAFLLRLGIVLYLTALPLVLLHEFWLQVWGTGWARSWDGSGHFGVAQVYDQTIFPDTFGWTNGYFGGMPFPNFYPPVFYWCVSLLHHLHIFSLPTAFKLMVGLPLVLMPAAVWLLTRKVSGGNEKVARWATIASLFPLVTPQFHGSFATGLNYYDTFTIGLYTQTLAFVMMAVWYVLYVDAHLARWRWALSSLLLALVLLSNFFTFNVAAIFIAVTVLYDLDRYRRAGDAAARREARRALLAHLTVPAVAMALSLFWLVPMMSEYKYFVTQPLTDVFVTTGMMVLYVLAAVGLVFWVRRPTPQMWPYLTVAFIIAGILIFSAAVAPSWFPLQAFRYSSTLSFLLAPAVGYALATPWEGLKGYVYRRFRSLKPRTARFKPYAVGVLLALWMLFAFASSQTLDYKLYSTNLTSAGFYPAARRAPADHIPPVSPELLSRYPEWFKDFVSSARVEFGGPSGFDALSGVLGFAREHRDGRYLVEVPYLYTLEYPAFEYRAINSYLGAQGNEALSIVFREASPNSLFMNPLVNAFSVNPDSFGFSSVLADDIDFAEQPLARQVERARLLGVRYLVIHTPRIKDRLAQEAGVGQKQDFGDWSVYQLRDEPAPKVQVLPFRPALVLSDYSVKGRRREDFNFVRLAEEQFADGWFDTMLVLSPETRADKLGDAAQLSQFGAIIIDKYDYDDFEVAYRSLRAFAQQRPLILLESSSMLFHRIRNSLEEFPMATVVERVEEANSPALQNMYGPSYRYRSSAIRQQWAQIRAALERNRTPTKGGPVGWDIKQDQIQINYDPAQATPGEPAVPVLISTTYHPNWRRDDGGRVYTASPMYMLTFVDRPTHLSFPRRWFDRLALWGSALTLVGLLGFCVWSYGGRLKRARRGEARSTAEAAPSEVGAEPEPKPVAVASE